MSPQRHDAPGFETDVAERPERHERSKGVERQMTAQNWKADDPGDYAETTPGSQVPQVVSGPLLPQPAARFMKHSSEDPKSWPSQLMPIESVTAIPQPSSLSSVEHADEFLAPEKTELLTSGKTEEEGRSEYSLLLPPTAVSHRTKAQSGPSSAPLAPATPRPQDRRITAASAGEPDEIQIHIGKIEVLAVPQTPAPAAVKTPRKAMSLDQYLQQRDRSRL